MLDLLEIRTEILAAVATHPVLHDQLVLKGGNALALVHKVGMRTSLDIDYSMEDDLEDPETFGLILRDALQARFESHELIVFDFRFEPRLDRRRPLEHGAATTPCSSSFHPALPSRWATSMP